MKVICIQCGHPINMVEQDGKLIPDKCPSCSAKIIGIKTDKFGDHLITILEDFDD